MSDVWKTMQSEVQYTMGNGHTGDLHASLGTDKYTLVKTSTTFDKKDLDLTF